MRWQVFLIGTCMSARCNPFASCVPAHTVWGKILSVLLAPRPPQVISPAAAHWLCTYRGGTRCVWLQVDKYRSTWDDKQTKCMPAEGSWDTRKGPQGTCRWVLCLYHKAGFTTTATCTRLTCTLHTEGKFRNSVPIMWWRWLGISEAISAA